MKFGSLLLAFLFLLPIHAQDFHFSQMKFTPMNVNPSLTGLNGKYNAIINYRTQWNSVASPYTTFGGSFDMNFNDKARRKGFLAGGVNFYHDIAGDLKMTTSNFNFNLAYHIRTSRTSTLGIGLQGGYTQRGIGPVNGFFASQYDGNGFDPTVSSGENFQQNNNGSVDLGGGAVFKHNSLNENSFNSGGYMFSAGLAAYHLTQPSYSYLQGGSDDLFVRFSAFVESEFLFRNPRFSFMPALYYQRQGEHQELLLGSYFKYAISQSSRKTSLKNSFSISYGAFLRVGDAFINKLLIDYNGYVFGVAYDLNVSSLARSSKGRGGVELMFRYYLLEQNRTKARIR